MTGDAGACGGQDWGYDLQPLRVRLDLAAEALLKNDRPIIEIADVSGFASASHLIGTSAMAGKAAPLGRAGKPEEIAEAVFLCSDETSFSTAADNVADGGWSNV